MAQHLKSIIKNRLRRVISSYAPYADISASHARGVRYFVPAAGIEYLCGAMNTVKEGRRYKKHIVVRRHSGRRDVLQLYTYHFPKTWSAACVANRELIKEAQRRAHALEHDHSYASIEWHIRFLKHYFRVFKGGAEPEPGMKRYSRFYQYTYVAIYRDLKAAQQQQQQALDERGIYAASSPSPEDVSFKPIEHVSRPRSSLYERKISMYISPARNILFSEACFDEGVRQNSSSRGRVTPSVKHTLSALP